MKQLKLLGVLALIIILAAACRKEWPDWQNEEGKAWIKDGLTLKSGLGFGQAQTTDTIYGTQQINLIFWVVNEAGQVVSGVDFDFGDDSTATGGQVAHKYANPGMYIVTAIYGSTELMRPVKIATVGENDQEAIFFLSGSYSGGINTIALGLARDKISNISFAGWYFYFGSEDNWSWPPMALTDTLIQDGKVLIEYEFSMPNGWNKFGYGKFPDNLNYDPGWGSAPASIYWHTTTTGGEFWVYVYNGNIYPEEQTPTLPGEWGDKDTDEPWAVRGLCDVFTEDSTVNVNLFINRLYLIEPSSPYVSWSLDGLSWQDAPLSNQGEYWSVTLHDIAYGEVLHFKAFSATGVEASLQASTFYHDFFDCCIMQLPGGV